MVPLENNLLRVERDHILELQTTNDGNRLLSATSQGLGRTYVFESDRDYP